jgi:hypothetical protein
MSSARRIDSIMFDNGIRGDRGSIEFEFSTYYHQDQTVKPYSMDPQRDLLSCFDPPRLKHILKNDPKQFSRSEHTELLHTVVTSENQYVFTIHTFPLNKRNIGTVNIIVSGIAEHPDNGDGRFIQSNVDPITGESEYRRFISLVKFEHQVSIDAGMLSALAADHKQLLNRLEIEDESDMLRVLVDSTQSRILSLHTLFMLNADRIKRMMLVDWDDTDVVMITALASGQHERLGEHSPLISLRSDLFRVLVDLTYPRTPQPTWSDKIIFFPAPGNDFEIMKNEVLEMRVELAKSFKIIEATVDDKRETENCRIKVDSINYRFVFYYTSIPSISVDCFKQKQHFKDFTGFESFVVFLKLLAERLTPEDKARNAYDELTAPMNLMYGSDEMRIFRILKDDCTRCMEKKITISLSTYVFDAAVSKFDALFNATQSSFEEGWNSKHERMITVNGYDYKVHMVYVESAKDWEDDSAYCHIYGIYEPPGTYSNPGSFSGIKAFNFVLDLLAADLTDEDRSRPRLHDMDYPRLGPSEEDDD